MSVYYNNAALESEERDISEVARRIRDAFETAHGDNGPLSRVERKLKDAKGKDKPKAEPALAVD